MRGRSGAVSVAELVLVAWLFAFVLVALATFAGAITRMAAAQGDRLRQLDLVRTAAVVLGGELRYVAPVDVRDGAPDSLRTRAIRGGGPVCGAAGEGLLVRYRGSRLPEPRKDSVLVVSAGGEVALPVEAVAWEEACGGGALRIGVGRAAGSGGLVLVFETGTYALTGGALRYRLGRGGRQPLTEALLRDGGLRITEGGWLSVALAMRQDSLPRAPGGRTHLRLPLLNLVP